MDNRATEFWALLSPSQKARFTAAFYGTTYVSSDDLPLALVEAALGQADQNLVEKVLTGYRSVDWHVAFNRMVMAATNAEPSV